MSPRYLLELEATQNSRPIPAVRSVNLFASNLFSVLICFFSSFLQKFLFWQRIFCILAGFHQNFILRFNICNL